MWYDVDSEAIYITCLTDFGVMFGIVTVITFWECLKMLINYLKNWR